MTDLLVSVQLPNDFEEVDKINQECEIGFLGRQCKTKSLLSKHSGVWPTWFRDEYDHKEKDESRFPFLSKHDL